ncbi:hypothetical protein GGX14DRAFT_568385 [Mycena pura]|uniref:Uncharacterized protein n=1 Tax=Mycena pura TaxID=153505 RepID=A0AAD6Y807_9AGAR|nr:hypothetical protein GGX14DRAFT_568385 [Mycena pura]
MRRSRFIDAPGPPRQAPTPHRRSTVNCQQQAKQAVTLSTTIHIPLARMPDALRRLYLDLASLRTAPSRTAPCNSATFHLFLPLHYDSIFHPHVLIAPDELHSLIFSLLIPLYDFFVSTPTLPASASASVYAPAYVTRRRTRFRFQLPSPRH